MSLFLKEKHHWYDGRLYGWVLDPLLWKIRRALLPHIPHGGSVLDIACGTGALLRQLAPTIAHGVGIDASSRMARHAKTLLRQAHYSHIEILHGDARQLVPANEMRVASDDIKVQLPRFDVVTCVIALHEMPIQMRREVLSVMHHMAEIVLIADFAAPPPHSPLAYVHRIAERLAGKEHYHNYLTFLEHGGILPLLKSWGRTAEVVGHVHDGVYCIVKAVKTDAL